ncbi:MAG: type I glutamate--ammonia ligase [bacterium]
MKRKEDIDIIKGLIEEKRALFIDLKFIDLYGRWHHLTINAKALKDDLLTVGVGVDGSSLGYRSVESGDLTIIPDIDTAFIDPFFEDTTISFLCDITESSNEKPFHLDPRQIARKCEIFLNKTLKGTRALFSPELEFFLLDKVKFSVSPHNSFFNLTSYEHEETMSGADIRFQDGYHHILPGDYFANFRNTLCRMLSEIDIPIKYHHHEVGAMGQQEIELEFFPLLKMADTTMLVKYFVRNLAANEGLVATFMPKPIVNSAGNGMHIHQYLEKDGLSLFYDKDGPSCLSELALKYIGGILQNGTAIFALTNPSVNSYKRLSPHFEAPQYLFHSEANRTAAIRIPSYAKNEIEMRIEYRAPDATCNPYLALSAIVLAGLYGIEKNILAPDPLVGNFEEQPQEIREKFKRVPQDLKEALLEFKRNHDFLFINDIFTDDFVKAWLSLKYNEVLRVEKHITPVEFYLYFDT